MLTHMVVWKYLPETTQATRDKHFVGLRSLAGLVTGLESLAVGFDTLHLPRSYDTGLVAVFRDHAALDEYTVHPDHAKVANFGREISAHVASVDFET
jgi:stress responsive alpha/beta barrel protein